MFKSHIYCNMFICLLDYVNSMKSIKLVMWFYDYVLSLFSYLPNNMLNLSIKFDLFQYVLKYNLNVMLLLWLYFLYCFVLIVSMCWCKFND